MKINVNDKSVSTSASTVRQLVAELSLPESGVAVALDNKMVPRTSWETTPLSEGDNVIIIKAACGG